MKSPQLFPIAMALAVLLAACGDSGNGSPAPFGVDGEFIIAPLTAYGAALEVPGTRANLVLRNDGVRYELIDVPGDRPDPQFLGRPIFSSRSTAWAIGSQRLNVTGGANKLLRSDDGGVTWRIAGALPPLQEGLVLSLLVEESADGTAIATIAMASDISTLDASLVAPRVFRELFDGSSATDWIPVPGVASGRYPTVAVLRTRSGRTELLRQSATGVRGEKPPDPAPSVDAIDASGATPVLRLDDRFEAKDFTTYGHTGWIIGRRLGANAGDSDAHAAIVRFDDDLDPVESVLLVQPSVATTVDFADDSLGAVCGLQGDEVPFCLATADGGATWTRDALPPEISEVQQVLRGKHAMAWALARTRDGTQTILVSNDDAATWSAVPLRPLGESVSAGTMARNSAAPGWLPAAVATASPRPTPLPQTQPPQGAGPRAWIVGDSTAFSPGITGALLMSNDLGASWQTVGTEPGITFTDVKFVSRKTGWAVGSGHVLHTDDGGDTFTDQIAALSFLGHDLRPRSLFAIDAHRAVMTVQIENSESLVFTDDGGVTWQPSAVEDAPQEPLAQYRMCLTADGSGIAWRGDERISLSSDGGASWRLGPTFAWHIVGDGYSASGFGFNNAHVACSGVSDLWILASGGDARSEVLWHSPDGGGTWENLTSAVGLIPSYLSVVGTFLPTDSCSGWLAIEQAEPMFPFERTFALVDSQDCGRSWQMLPSPLVSGGADQGIPEFPVSIQFADARTGMMVTNGRSPAVDDDSEFAAPSALVTRDGGNTWLRSPLPDGFHPFGLALAP